MQYNRVIPYEQRYFMNLKESVVLITGAGSGIGASLANHFGQKGSMLFLADRDPKAVLKTTEILRGGKNNRL